MANSEGVAQGQTEEVCSGSGNDERGDCGALWFVDDRGPRRCEGVPLRKVVHVAWRGFKVDPRGRWTFVEYETGTELAGDCDELLFGERRCSDVAHGCGGER